MKQRKKRTVFLLLFSAGVFVIWLTMITITENGEDNIQLLQNASLENVQENGIPESWFSDAYCKIPGYTDISLLSDTGPDGQNAVHIVNHIANDSRVAQTVAVKPDTIYRLSGWICASASDGWGANLSVAGVYSSTSPLFETDGTWKYVELYGKTNQNQHAITVYLRLGGYGGESSGEAFFSGVSLIEITTVPPGAYISDFFPPSEAIAEDSQRCYFDLRYFLILFLAILVCSTLLANMKHNMVHGCLLLAVLLGAFCILCNVLLYRRSIEEELVDSPVYLLCILSIICIVLSVLFALIILTRINSKGLSLNQPCFKEIWNQADTLSSTHQNMHRIDWMIMSTITILYAVLAFVNLGSVYSPQTYYTFAAPDEYVVFDLGEVKRNFQILYFGGIQYTDSDFVIQISDDRTQWNQEINCQMDIGDLYKWMYVKNPVSNDSRNHSGRYIRLKACHAGLCLQEVIFRDSAGVVLDVTETDSLGYDVAALTDEQTCLSGEPSWFNSMYFDEIYHARTAYEFLQHLSPYEITHPPLGKVIMSWAIAVFGMSPFGWRFAGTLCGVLMLPCMYLLGHLLFERRVYAILACVTMALDTMHFTQTRLATIDSFVVLFSIWSIYFMLRWFYLTNENTSFHKEMLPLLFSGIFIGLAISSKWSGAFAGMALAFIFSYGMFIRIRRTFKRKEKLGNPKFGNTSPIKDIYFRLSRTIICCILFFVLIPAVIYYCSYIPYFSASGDLSIHAVIESARYMLWYHGREGFGADHFFSSPWYEWPLSQKPMYYAMHQYTPVDSSYSIFAMGNYAIWWIGFVSILMLVVLYCRSRLMSTRNQLYSEHKSLRLDSRPVILLICYVVQLMPWIFVPRGTYIYHYFPMVPFVILSTVYMLQYMDQELQGSRKHSISTIITVLYFVLVLAFFMMLFPIASGVTVPIEWLDAINWFGNLYY